MILQCQNPNNDPLLTATIKHGRLTYNEFIPLTFIPIDSWKFCNLIFHKVFVQF